MLGLTLNLTFHVIFGGYSKLPKEGARGRWMFSFGVTKRSLDCLTALEDMERCNVFFQS